MQRLATALDSGGYPAQRIERANAFGAALRIESAMADQLLSGEVLPELTQLLALCEMLGLQPGYFLDQRVVDLPPGTVLVKPLVAGEDLVLRLPSEVLDPRELQGGLIYWRARERMGFGIAPGDYLIAFDPTARLEPESRGLYLFQEEAGFSVRECTERSSGRAVFRSDGADEVPLIVPTGGGRDRRNFSRLLAKLRCGANLQLRH